LNGLVITSVTVPPVVGGELAEVPDVELPPLAQAATSRARANSGSIGRLV
jgi:hypothetical protein